MFHPKDNTTENSDTMELNELKTEDRIREYENEQGELIFECFQDEVSWVNLIFFIKVANKRIVSFDESHTYTLSY